MSPIDWSGNGTLTDEGIWLTAVLTFLGTLITIRLSQRRIAAQVDNIDANLNHVGEPEGNDGPTIGQRVAKIDDRLDRVETSLNRRADRLDDKVDRIAVNLNDLTSRMMDHIADEAGRTSRLEDSVRDMDRRHWEAHRGETQSG